MQRRAAAAYIAFFLVIAAGSYAFIATAHEPDVTLSGDNVQEIEKGDNITVNDRTYTVSDVSASTGGGGGGHGGGGGGLEYTIALEWTNDSATYTETWPSNSTVEFDNQTRRVTSLNGTDRVRLRWEPGDRLRPAWENGTLFIDGDLDKPGRQDVPLTEYIENSSNQSIQDITYSESDTFERNGNRTTISNVSNSTVTLKWTAPKTNEVSAGQNSNLTLNGQEYAVHFKNNDTVLLGQGKAAQKSLHDQLGQQDRFHDRINGVWGVTIGSATAAFLLIALAFLPRKE